MKEKEKAYGEAIEGAKNIMVTELPKKSSMNSMRVRMR